MSAVERVIKIEAIKGLSAYDICDLLDKLERVAKVQHLKIQQLESELKKRDELLREAVSFVEYAEKDRYQNTFFTYFLNKPEVKKISEKK